MVLTAEHVRNLLHTSRPDSEGSTISHHGLIPSAVLVPLVSLSDETHVLLTKRTDAVETHKGHIAFPGGMVDEDDRDRIATALRETREEVGIMADAIDVIGCLDELVTPTGFVITPVVGLLRTMPTVAPNPREVAEVFVVPFSFLVDPENCIHADHLTEHGLRSTWRFDYQGRVIWGATAAILRNLLQRLGLLPEHLST